MNNVLGAVIGLLFVVYLVHVVEADRENRHRRYMECVKAHAQCMVPDNGVYSSK